MNAGELMTTPVVSVTTDTPLKTAVGLMVSRKISGLPVVDAAGLLVGVLTEGDLLRRFEVGTDDRHYSGWRNFLRGPGLNAAEYVRTHSRKVADLMTSDPASVTEGATLEAVVEIMENRRVKRLPVVRAGMVIGVVSRSDVLRAVDARLNGPEASHGSLSDDEILRGVKAELARQPWFTDRNVAIEVDAGVVSIAGGISDPDMAAAIRVAAQNAPGVLRVIDRLELVSPIAGSMFA